MGASVLASVAGTLTTVTALAPQAQPEWDGS
jgi:hypothetical protein